MKLREWSGNRLVAVLAAGWFAASALVAVVRNTNTNHPIIDALILVLFLVPCFIATVWSWNRIEVGSWHFGKILILWALLGVLSLMFGHIKESLQTFALLLGGVPLLVLTWFWLTAREKQ
jgi:hypothetical protein